MYVHIYMYIYIYVYTQSHPCCLIVDSVLSGMDKLSKLSTWGGRDELLLVPLTETNDRNKENWNIYDLYKSSIPGKV